MVNINTILSLAYISPYLQIEMKLVEASKMCVSV